ncbi:MAG: hypothetical protein V1773_10405 [bacterium]
MKKIIILFLMLSSILIKAQYEITAGMGLNFVNSPSFTDYVNVNFALQSDRLSSMNSAVEFYGEFSYDLSPSFGLGLDYSNLIFSFNTISHVGTYDVNYLHYKPSLVVYYQIPGEGYKFKFGAGLGPRFVSLDEKLPYFSNSLNYSTTGIGFLLRAEGNTLLSGDMYANINFDLRYDLPGEPDGDKKLTNRVLNETVNVNSVSFAIKLGISYKL